MNARASSATTGGGQEARMPITSHGGRVRSRSLNDLQGGLRVPVLRRPERLKTRLEASLAGLEELRVLKERHRNLVDQAKQGRTRSVENLCSGQVSEHIPRLRERLSTSNLTRINEEGGKDENIPVTSVQESARSNFDFVTDSRHDACIYKDPARSRRPLSVSDCTLLERDFNRMGFNKELEFPESNKKSECQARAENLNCCSFHSEVAKPDTVSTMRRASFQCHAVITNNLSMDQVLSRLTTSGQFPSPMHAVLMQYRTHRNERQEKNADFPGKYPKLDKEKVDPNEGDHQNLGTESGADMKGLRLQKGSKAHNPNNSNRSFDNINKNKEFIDNQNKVYQNVSLIQRPSVSNVKQCLKDFHCPSGSYTEGTRRRTFHDRQNLRIASYENASMTEFTSVGEGSKSKPRTEFYDREVNKADRQAVHITEYRPRFILDNDEDDAFSLCGSRPTGPMENDSEIQKCRRSKSESEPKVETGKVMAYTKNAGVCRCDGIRVAPSFHRQTMMTSCNGETTHRRRGDSMNFLSDEGYFPSLPSTPRGRQKSSSYSEFSWISTDIDDLVFLDSCSVVGRESSSINSTDKTKGTDAVGFSGKERRTEDPAESEERQNLPFRQTSL